MKRGILIGSLTGVNSITNCHFFLYFTETSHKGKRWFEEAKYFLYNFGEQFHLILREEYIHDFSVPFTDN